LFPPIAGGMVIFGAVPATMSVAAETTLVEPAEFVAVTRIRSRWP
jgi:hypothetical protein